MHWRKPSWFIITVTAASAYCLGSLGVWQLQRAEEKRQILNKLETRTNHSARTIRLPVSQPETFRYQRIQLQGQYASDQQLVLDNRIQNRQVGYNILTPFHVKNTSFKVLVDRGWLPAEASRDRLPAIDVDESMRTISGTIYVPFGEPYRLGTVDNDGTAWPRLIQYLDFAALSERLGAEVQPFTLRLDQDQPHGYLREWQLFAFSPKRHVAYAVQWFALALVLLIMFVVLHTSRSNHVSRK